MYHLEFKKIKILTPMHENHIYLKISIIYF